MYKFIFILSSKFTKWYVILDIYVYAYLLLRGQDMLSSKQEVTQGSRIKQEIKTSNITKT